MGVRAQSLDPHQPYQLDKILGDDNIYQEVISGIFLWVT